MATHIFLRIEGVQGNSDAPNYEGAFSVSTFEMRGPGGGAWPVGGPFEMRGPGGGAAPVRSSPGELLVTIGGGAVLAQLSQAFGSKRTFAAGTLTIVEGGPPIVFNYELLTVIGISGIADDEGSEYQITFAFGSVT